MAIRTHDGPKIKVSFHGCPLMVAHSVAYVLLLGYVSSVGVVVFIVQQLYTQPPKRPAFCSRFFCFLPQGSRLSIKYILGSKQADSFLLRNALCRYVRSYMFF